ncbi:MAG: AmmeMemoRadiSam system radical SAM enzyme [Lachnospiraceae bacterium]|nr:AmmeMemoRadiSam system radical SAM enzyme [Lachnospiraceae bacterium]
MSNTTLTCDTCFHHCALRDGQKGLCLSRKRQGESILPIGYGRISSLALDLIEKKPLYHFHPGRPIVSVGGLGCNLRCPFCQNSGISQSDNVPTRNLSPQELIAIAEEARTQYGNLGIAFTYNEPLINYEYIIDCGVLARKRDLCIVLVSNGTADPSVIRRLLPYVDAANIDLKGFSSDIYDRLGGSFDSVKETIALCCRNWHVEITSLIVEGFNDSPSDMEQEARWIASLDSSIPLHITRSFPHYRMPDLTPTSPALMQEMKAIAERYLAYVHLGNL